MDRSEKVMKEPESYNLMFRFLDQRYKQLASEELGSLLGELQLATDGKPFDLAIEQDWNRVVEAAQADKRPVSIPQQRRAS